MHCQPAPSLATLILLTTLGASPVLAGQGKLPSALNGSGGLTRQKRSPCASAGPDTALLRLGPRDLGLLPAPLSAKKLRLLKRSLGRVSSVEESSRMLHAVGMHYHAAGDPKRALAAYEQLLKDPASAGYSRLDSVLYLAAELLLASDPPRARLRFKRLIMRRPTSRVIPHVYLAFGRWYLDQAKPRFAVRFFDRVIRFKNSRAVGYAHYLRGRAQLQLKQHQEALASFYRVSNAQSRVLIPSQACLDAAAQGGAVLAYAEVGAPRKARNFFLRMGGKAAPQMLRQLAQLYRQRGRRADARAVTPAPGP